MQNHTVKVYPSKHALARDDQLAWKIAAVATDPVEVESDVADMVINRIIDNASVAMAAINRTPPRHDMMRRACRTDGCWVKGDIHDLPTRPGRE